MPTKIVRRLKRAPHGEPRLDSLLADPVMTTLWRADRIDPDHAKQLFADTKAKLHRRNTGKMQIDKVQKEA